MITNYKNSSDYVSTGRISNNNIILVLNDAILGISRILNKFHSRVRQLCHSGKQDAGSKVLYFLSHEILKIYHLPVEIYFKTGSHRIFIL